MSVQCVIPAGGQGKRLGNITKHVPKPLIKILNEKFIVYLIASLINQKFKNFIILTSFKHNNFNFLYKKFNKFNIKIKFIKDKKRNGTYNALLNAKKYLNNFFIYCNSDEIVNLKISPLLKIYKNKKCKVLQLCFKDTNGKLKLKYKKFRYTEAGLKIINKNVLKKSKKKYKKIEDFLMNEIDSKNIYFKIINEKPFSIDTWNRIKRTKKFLKSLKFNFI